MSTGSSSIKFKTPAGVVDYLNQANDYISQEATRLQQQQAALTGSQGDVLSALGMSQGNDPYVSKMLGTLLSGGEINPADYPELAKSGTAPTAPAAVANPGARPVEYKAQFTGKNWGKNDQAKQDASLKAIQAWDQKNALYQQYQQQKAAYDQQKAAYDASPSDYGSLNRYKEQAQTLYDMVQQRQSQVGLGRDILGQLQTALAGGQGTADQMNSLQDRLNAALTGDPALDNSLKSQFETAQQKWNALQSGDWSGNVGLNQTLSDMQQQLYNKMYLQLGSGWASSSAGIEMQKKFAEGSAAAQGQAYRDDLSQALQQLQGTQGNYLNQLRGEQGTINNAQAALANQQETYLQNIMSLLGAYGNTIQGSTASAANSTSYLNSLLGYGQNLAGTIQNVEQTPYSVSLQSIIDSLQKSAAAYGSQSVGTQSSGSQLGSILSSLGSLVGTAAGAYFGGPAGAAAGGQFGGQLGSAAGGGVQMNGLTMRNSQGYNLLHSGW